MFSVILVPFCIIIIMSHLNNQDMKLMSMLHRKTKNVIIFSTVLKHVLLTYTYTFSFKNSQYLRQKKYILQWHNTGFSNRDWGVGFFLLFLCWLYFTCNAHYHIIPFNSLEVCSIQILAYRRPRKNVELTLINLGQTQSYRALSLKRYSFFLNLGVRQIFRGGWIMPIQQFFLP